METEFPKNFDAAAQESALSRLWEENRVFEPDVQAGKKPFCIIMPPPNANDPLHVGHAMFIAIEDIFIRYHRMKGDAALWLPGTDHAGIETQFVFEKKLAKQGKSRFDFDRNTLYQMIWDYVRENSDIAVNQMKALGASADWSRFTFTLDPDIVALVLDTFEKLYKDGLVYRGERLVNYCTKCGTGYSELEVEYEERNDKLYFLKYPIKDGGEVVVATTRPETMLGDTAVAVNPKDGRFADLVGKTVLLPILNREIPIIADEMVDMAFGTGAVKITPAHDKADYETSERHTLAVIQVIGTDGRMTEEAGKFAGMKVAAARDAVMEEMGRLGLAEKIEAYTHNVGVCYRCHTVIEPLPLAQFFVKTPPLADRALKALDSKETIVLGAGREKILRDWLMNIKDWNISRQIVWGIRIPVWYDMKKNPDIVVGFLDAANALVQGPYGEISRTHDFADIERGLQFLRAPKEAEFVVSREKPKGVFLQETDSFDTWFSSGQWPAITLQTSAPGDFEYFYPTTVMETAYDILTRWVMRMMLLCIYMTGASPFQYVYLHGLVRDEKGRKMSKSIGNVVNPLDVVARYGADALRFALVMSTTPGNDSSVGEDKIRGMRNFVTKVWNASKFIDGYANKADLSNADQASGDASFKERLMSVVQDVTHHLEQLRPGQAAEIIHNEFWHWFCDEAIENVKKGNVSIKQARMGLQVFLKMLHPFMPFVTEALWQRMFRHEQEPLLARAQWPLAS